MDALFEVNNAFVAGGFQHKLVVALFLIVGSSLVIYGRFFASEKASQLLFKFIAWTMFFAVVGWTLCEMAAGEFAIQNDLPFFICNMMALLMPIYATNRSKAIFGIFYFWILTGTLQAMITPDLVNAFPHYHFIKFWIVHAGLIIVLVYSMVVFRLLPDFKDVFRAFGAFLLYLLGVVIINACIGANYFYINQKPRVPTFLDALGEWPQYVFVGLALILPYFLAMYLPVFVYKRLRDRLGGKKESLPA